MTKVDLEELMNSWENLALVINEVGKNQDQFEILMDIALYGKEKNSWRAAYMVDKIHENHPDIVAPYIEKIINQLKIENHPGKKRHFLKQISLNKIPENYYGFLVDYCLSALSSSKEAPAVRVHAMQILFNISEFEPDLKSEILLVIEHEMEFHSTAGIISRGVKLAKKLRKQIS